MTTSCADPSYPCVGASETALNPLAEHGELDLVGHSAAIKRLRVQVERIAPHFRSVLIRGECGTGKELVARALHAAGGHVGESFLLRDATTVEGYLRAEASVGTLAEGTPKGTLFLDGVEELSLPAQDWLLRTLGWEEPAPSARSHLSRIEMRVIASTTDDLRTLAAAGRFRPALYHRLATVEIVVPPLRERAEDIPELARYFLNRFRRLYGRGARGIASDAMRRLQEHRWPGNVRELSEVIRDGVLQGDADLLREENLSILGRPLQGGPTADASVRLQDVVDRHVLGVLKDCAGNKLRAADRLGISRSTLYRMLESGGAGATLR
jgi:DNA-binding NtrC family response regulator